MWSQLGNALHIGEISWASGKGTEQSSRDLGSNLKFGHNFLINKKQVELLLHLQWSIISFPSLFSESIKYGQINKLSASGFISKRFTENTVCEREKDR